MKPICSLILLTLTLITSNSFAGLNQAPEINLPGINKTIQLKNYKGKVVYLDFWASWCLPCKESFPWMQRLKQSHEAQGFEIIAINLDKDRSLANYFLKNVDVNFEVAFDESGQSASLYKLKGMPSSYLIGRDGKVHASHIGFREKDKQRLEQAVISLLNK